MVGSNPTLFGDRSQEAIVVRIATETGVHSIARGEQDAGDVCQILRVAWAITKYFGPSGPLTDYLCNGWMVCAYQ